MQIVHQGKVIRRVAVVDDKEEARESMAEWIVEAGFEPCIQHRVDGSVDDFLSKLRREVDAIVFDQHLRPGNYATFNGSDAVSKAYDMNIPSVLVTAIAGADFIHIVPYRRKIPVLIDSTKADWVSIANGIELCVKEFESKVVPERAPYRTLVRVEELSDEDDGRPLMYLVIPAWNPHKKVPVPRNFIDGGLQKRVLVGEVFFADVNIGALRHQDLFFDNFQLADELEGEYAKLVHT